MNMNLQPKNVATINAVIWSESLTHGSARIVNDHVSFQVREQVNEQVNRHSLEQVWGQVCGNIRIQMWLSLVINEIL